MEIKGNLFDCDQRWTLANRKCIGCDIECNVHITDLARRVFREKVPNIFGIDLFDKFIDKDRDIVWRCHLCNVANQVEKLDIPPEAFQTLQIEREP